MKDFCCMTLVFGYILSVLVGTVYLIQWYNWSCWWMVLAVILVSGKYKVDDKEIKPIGINK